MNPELFATLRKALESSQTWQVSIEDVTQPEAEAIGRWLENEAKIVPDTFQYVASKNSFHIRIDKAERGKLIEAIDNATPQNGYSPHKLAAFEEEMILALTYRNWGMVERAMPKLGEMRIIPAGYNYDKAVRALRGVARNVLDQCKEHYADAPEKSARLDVAISKALPKDAEWRLSPNIFPHLVKPLTDAMEAGDKEGAKAGFEDLLAVGIKAMKRDDWLGVKQVQTAAENFHRYCIDNVSHFSNWQDVIQWAGERLEAFKKEVTPAQIIDGRC